MNHRLIAASNASPAAKTLAAAITRITWAYDFGNTVSSYPGAAFLEIALQGKTLAVRRTIQDLDPSLRDLH